MKKKLLFFFADETCTSTSAVVPTLSRLSKEAGVDFETYICTRPDSWQGNVLPLVGHGHMESFYYLANFYEQILYCSITDRNSFQFRREVLAFGGKVISARKSNEVAQFYQDIYSYFGLALPKTALVIPDECDTGRNYAPFCYPDILHSDMLGVSESIWNNSKAFLKEAGVEKALSLYCTLDDAEIFDAAGENDCYATVTERICRRHLDTAKQIGFNDPPSMKRWLAHLCREEVVTLYEDVEWEKFIPTVAKLAKTVGNPNIIGSQNVYIPQRNFVSCNDDVVTALGEHGLYMNALGINPRIGFTIQTTHKLPLDWLDDPNGKTPWDDEYSDEFLLEKLEKRATPVCFLFYAADLGHLPGMQHFINMMCLDGLRGGIAFPSTWYNYQPELLEQMYLPLEQGGVCPQLEPLVSSLGVAVGTEAEGFVSAELLQKLLKTACNDIAKHVGEKRVPRGYYPFQDASPFYKKDSGTPQYEAVSKLGFEYYITYKDSCQRGAIKYEGNGMTAFSQQTPQWFPGYGHPLERLKQWEAECAERRNEWKQDPKKDAFDYIVLSFDTPFFAMTPTYLGEMERNPNGFGAMHYIYDAMQYVRRTGGKDGNLFMVKPHELYRYIKLAKKHNIMK